MVRALALIELVELKVTPPVPAVKLSVGEARMPVARMPPAAFDAFKLKEEPELEARLNVPA